MIVCLSGLLMEAHALRVSKVSDSSRVLDADAAIMIIPSSLVETNVPISDAARVGIYALGGIFIVAAIRYISQARKDEGNVEHDAKQGIFGICTWSNMLLFCVWNAMSCSHLFFQSNAGITGPSALLAVAVICFMKFTISIMLFVFRRTSSAESVEKEHVVLGQWVFMTFIPGALYASYDVISFWSLASVSPLTYQICIHGRIALAAVFYQVAFARMLSVSQWFAIVLFICAGLVQATEQFSRESLNESFHGLLLIMGQICISVMANVTSEKILKMKNITAPTELVIASQNLWSMILLFLAIVLTDRDLLTENTWQIFWQDKWTLYSTLNLAVFGVVTCYFLRNFSNILRELSASIVIVLTFAVQLVVYFQFSGFGLLSTLLAVAALSVYNVDPL